MLLFPTRRRWFRFRSQRIFIFPWLGKIEIATNADLGATMSSFDLGSIIIIHNVSHTRNDWNWNWDTNISCTILPWGWSRTVSFRITVPHVIKSTFRFEIKINYGNEDYKTGVQYYLNLEVLNHEDGIVQLQKIFQSYGRCQWINQFKMNLNQWIQKFYLFQFISNKFLTVKFQKSCNHSYTPKRP